MSIAVLTLLAGSATARAAGASAANQHGPENSITVGVIRETSGSCPGQNAEVEQAVDPSGPGYVYEAWTGCQGIGFARSTNGGASYDPAITLPGSATSPGDPDVAVAPDGTVYVSFMVMQDEQMYPVVDTSFDDGATFTQETALTPPGSNNWGDSPNLAVGPDGTVYVTWDYGPSASAVDIVCSPVGSCSYLGGDLNVVIQKSTNEAQSFGTMVPISPGYPWSGADNGPIVVNASGEVEVLYQDYPTKAASHAFSPALNYFTSSADGGATWSRPVAVGSSAGTMSQQEWWNEPSLAIDSGGNLYAAWDTQGKARNGTPVDTGWLSYSEDNGATWSVPSQVPADVKNVAHIMEVAGGASGEAYVGWLSDSNPKGYALYLRPFSIPGGWLSSPVQVSTSFGNPRVWPGDTFGLSTLDPDLVVTSWGSAVPTDGTQCEIYATDVGSSESSSALNTVPGQRRR